MRQGDEPRVLRQTGRALLVALTLAACDPVSPALDAGADGGQAVVDAGRLDGGSERDAGPDAALADAGSADASSPACVASPESDPSGSDAFEDGARAEVLIDDRGACLRTYTMSTTATLRDGEPDNPRTFTERPDQPALRSGHDLFDALYAMALEEVRENAVSAVRDGAFDDGQAVSCGDGGCFSTGRLWSYVWTRDTAYSVDLGLATVDPARSLNSLEFKLSERRGGGNLQIVQDTGTGGSYPVSTDRVAWALGAWALLQELDGPAREAFAERALTAIANTLEHDRRVVFDADDGLYFGEQSFLDWREQTYPEWTEGDVAPIATSKALGTNLLHLRAMEVAASLAAERSDPDAAARYGAWADALRAAIQTRFWLEDEGLFSTYVTAALDPAPARRYDLLASALAIVFGVASPAQASAILAAYPHYGPGAPVIWPQQQETRIYHNRGEWPFVTAYWLHAARAGGNDAVADRMIGALVRGAALNLSHMENFEAGSGEPWLEDGAASGPVVNSQRQLWSVAGYLSMVHRTIFGLEARPDGLRVAPFVTAETRERWFGGTNEVLLRDYPYRGRRLHVSLHLPESGGTGALSVERVELDGEVQGSDVLAFDALTDGARVDVFLTPGGGPAASLTERDDADYQAVFGPRTPRVHSLVESGGRLELGLSTGGETASDVTFRIYRDGVVVADELPGSTTTWTDTGVDATSEESPCYVAELTFVSSGNHGQHSPATCWWGPGVSRIATFGADALTAVGGRPTSNHGRFHHEGWGDAGHSLTLESFTASQSGPHLLQLTYGNGAGSVTTGITCALKRIVVEDALSGAVVAEGVVVMPHLGDWSRWEDSSFVHATLEAGRAYRVVIRGDDETVNMSSFAHFETYTGGLGGRSGVFNRVNIAELKILAGR